MKMTSNDKTYDTALRLLEILKILLEEDISKKDIMEKLKINDSFERVYTTEAFIKYFNTLKIAGFIIEKNKNIYKLKNAFFSIDLTKDEVKLFCRLIQNTGKLHDENKEKTIKFSVNKIIKFIDKDYQEEIIAETQKNHNQLTNKDNIILRFENLKKDNQQVIITYYKKSNEICTITGEIKEVTEKNNSVQIVCYDPIKVRSKRINTNSIINVQQLPSKIRNSFLKDSVTFELYGRLANLYKLKPNEKMVNMYTDYIIVENHDEDRDVLIRRLLKYGENCKIVKPENFKKEFLEMTDEILKKLQGI